MVIKIALMKHHVGALASDKRKDSQRITVGALIADEGDREVRWGDLGEIRRQAVAITPVANAADKRQDQNHRPYPDGQSPLYHDAGSHAGECITAASGARGVWLTSCHKKTKGFTNRCCDEPVDNSVDKCAAPA